MNESATFQSGDVLYSSWGYEQTNVTFYLVTRSTPKTVWIQKIDSVKEEVAQAMSGITYPAKCDDDYIRIGDVIRRKIQPSGYVNIDDYRSAQRWDGSPKRFSSYA